MAVSRRSEIMEVGLFYLLKIASKSKGARNAATEINLLDFIIILGVFCG